MVNPAIKLPEKEVADFCRRWRNPSLALFGSVLGEDLSPDSDLDILVTFDLEDYWSLLNHVRMEQELAALLGREIDLFTKRSVERSHNPIRRQHILDTAEVIYEAR
ncbi:MAG: nucleotidyltransferase domain-containing protein [Anaerolineae bacterium]|nr:nucleotidyltransferase domain-containing protein [Anaerolineae bacterium]